MAEPTPTPLDTKAWIITGPTSGIGRRTALELAKHGTGVLVGARPFRTAQGWDGTFSFDLAAFHAQGPQLASRYRAR
jgi:NAD(P)-dependent dehydrogenase (short-subunit alcohol dehydrogenase family)